MRLKSDELDEMKTNFEICETWAKMSGMDKDSLIHFTFINH